MFMLTKSTPSPAFSEQSLLQNMPAQLQVLAPYAKIKIYDRDDIVLHHGDAAGSLWLIASGWVKLTRQTPDGKESIIGLCTEGDIFGEAALFAHANYPYNAQVLAAQNEIITIPSTIVRKLVAENTSLSATIMELLNERTSQTQLKLEHMTTMSAAQRLGCFLLRLCQAQINGRKELIIPVEKHVLAAYLGMKPETLSRSQQQLKPLGISVTGHTITIGSIENLRNFVCNSCSESGNCDAESAAD